MESRVITAISDTNKAILEQKYPGRPWHTTPENRAFIGARGQCESPHASYYEDIGARGIKFMYRDLDQLLADVGLRPNEKFVLERIDRSKNYEPGNVQWTPRSLVARKPRPIMQVERSVDSMMVRIIHTLRRQPDPHAEMERKNLQHDSGSSCWGSKMFHQALQQLIELGFVNYRTMPHTKTEPTYSGKLRSITRQVSLVSLKTGDNSGNLNNQSV